MGFTFTTDTYIALAALLQPYVKSALIKLKTTLFGKYFFHLPLHSAVTVEYASSGLVITLCGTIISPDREYYISSVEGLWISQLDKAERPLFWMGTSNSLVENSGESFEPPTVLRIPKGQPVKLKFILQDFRSSSEVRGCLDQIKNVFNGRIQELLKLQPNLTDSNYFAHNEAASEQAWSELKNYPQFHEARRQLSQIFPLEAGKYNLQIKIGTLEGKATFFNYVVTLDQSQLDQLDKFNQWMMMNFACSQNVPGAMYYKALPLYALANATTTIDIRQGNSAK